MQNDSKRMENIETTFREMGLRAGKSIAEHLLKENANESNLIQDVSQADYTKGNKGPTQLQTIENFGIFVDDLYTYGYLKKENVVFNRSGGVQCTTGPTGSASYILEQIRVIAKFTLGKNSPSSLHTSIMHTKALDKQIKGTILETIDKIERNKVLQK